MNEIEDLVLSFYKIVLNYTKDLWNKSLDAFYTFDFMLLTKISVIILMGYFLAKILSRYIPKAIQSMGKKVNIPIDIDFTAALRTFIFKLILFIFVLIAINMFHFPDSVNFIANATVKSILILSFVGFLLKMVKLILYKMANSPRQEDKESVHVVQASTLPLFENTALIFFALAGIYQVFSIWNVDMTALLAGAGIGAMAVGMAAKDTLSDIIAGILILTDAPYRVGDVVYVRNNLKGRVIAIGLRNTRLVTKSNIEIIVPNTIMGTSQIINESSSKKEGIRIEMYLSVSSGEEVNVVKVLLIEAAKVSKKIAQDKEIKSMMTGFQMDMLQFKIQCWINNPEDKGSAKGELMENIYFKFKEKGIDVTMTRYQHVKLSYEEAQELRITQFPDTEQKLFVKEFPNTKQEQFVKEFPDTKQEQFVKEFPDTKQEQFVKEFPDTKQEQFVKEFPDTKQEQFVKEFPDTQQDMNIKEIPNIFGVGKPKVLTKVSRNPSKKDIKNKENHEK